MRMPRPTMPPFLTHAGCFLKLAVLLVELIGRVGWAWDGLNVGDQETEDGRKGKRTVNPNDVLSLQVL